MSKSDRYIDLVLALVGLLAAVLLQASESSLAETTRPLAGVLFLACVGYALYSALTLVLAEQFSISARIALTIAAYLSLSIFIGIMLNGTEWGLTRQSWLASFTVVACAALLLSGLGRLLTDRYEVIPLDLTASQLMMLVFAGGLFATAFLLAQAGVINQPTEPFSQFWLVPDENSPVITGDATEKLTLRLGIFNVEGHRQEYRVRLLANRNVIDEWGEIVVAPDEKWEIEVELSTFGLVYPLEAELFLVEQTTVYRRTAYWPDSSPNILVSGG